MVKVLAAPKLALSEDTIQKLRLKSPAGGWFPALRTLKWRVSGLNFPYANLFISPHLKRVEICLELLEHELKLPSNSLSSTASTISALPVSALQVLIVDAKASSDNIPWQHFKDSLSSIVLRCGPSLVEFTSPVLLSDEAIYHLIQLPRLSVLRLNGLPPSSFVLSPPRVFPPLVKCTFGQDAMAGWLLPLKRLEDSIPALQGVVPLSRMKGLLECLTAEDSPGLIIDPGFTSFVQIFWNMVHLNIGARCHNEQGQGQCSFVLNDGNVVELAAALPRLETLRLGSPCIQNTCATTVACLLPISVYCAELMELEIHFNTTNIAEDFLNISKDPSFCVPTIGQRSLRFLYVHRTPLTIGRKDLLEVFDKLEVIFPALEYIEGLGRCWEHLSVMFSNGPEDNDYD